MWNYSYSLPTAFIFLLFLVYFFSGASLPVRRNRSFLILILSHGFTTVFDVWSSYLDNFYTEFSQNYLLIINLMFFVFFVIRSYAFVDREGRIAFQMPAEPEAGVREYWIIDPKHIKRWTEEMNTEE